MIPNSEPIIGCTSPSFMDVAYWVIRKIQGKLHFTFQSLELHDDFIIITFLRPNGAEYNHLLNKLGKAWTAVI